MDSNIKAEIHEIKVTSTVENVEETQDLTNRKFKDLEKGKTGSTGKRPQKAICRKRRATPLK